LQQFQQTRGTLAMLAQWISKAVEDGYRRARKEPLITLGSAPLDVTEFRSVVLGQLGEPRLQAAIDTDIAGERSHARTLDADTKGELRDIHRRVGATILFESSGGQLNRVAHLPELRFALGEPELDTTSVDTAAGLLEAKAFFIQRVGADGFKVFHKAKFDKAVHDRRASLDEEDEVKPTIRALVKEEFKRGASIPVELFPPDSTALSDSPRLKLVVLDPACEWDGGAVRTQIGEWTRNRGKSSRLYPGALVWCVRKPGRDLRDKVELLLAWRRVQKEVRDGVLGADFDKADLHQLQGKVAEAEQEARDEVWAGYRFVLLADGSDPTGLKVIDLGAGHSSGAETLCGRVVAALKAEALLNESVGAGYIDRNWPPAFKDSEAWPLASLRQSFLNGALTRLLDPDGVLKTKLVEFVGRGEFGLASGVNPDGRYERLWYTQPVPPEEVSFDPGVVLLKKSRAEALRKPVAEPVPTKPTDAEPVVTTPAATSDGVRSVGAAVVQPISDSSPRSTSKTLRLSGTVPPELWNRLGTRVIPKLRSGKDLAIRIEFSVIVEAASANDLEADLEQILDDLGLGDSVEVEQK
jgi:hypothetical protein